MDSREKSSLVSVMQPKTTIRSNYQHHILMILLITKYNGMKDNSTKYHKLMLDIQSCYDHVLHNNNKILTTQDNETTENTATST